ASAPAPAEAAAPPAAAAPAPKKETPAKPATVKAAAPATAGGKPKSTAEILAAARAEKAAAAAAAESAPADESPAAKPAAAKPAAAKPAAAKPAAGGAKPKSTAEILAALRAEKASGGAAAAAPASTPSDAPAAKPAAAKLAAKPAATEAAPVAGLSLEEMLSKVRPTTETAAAAPVAAPAKVAPPLPARPVKPAAAKKGPSVEERRGVLAMLASPFVFGWTAMTGILGAWGLGLARFMLPNVLTEPPSKFKIGPPADYDLGTVATKWVAQFGIWIVHTDQYQGKNLIYALASVCTHLGCTPSWLEGERKFKCPCHGSGFYITGVNFEGPAPRPLERVGLRLAEDGMLEVDKSLKFQEEMGQWNDSTSFFEVTA
ncbi:MAG: ubiquinol-cytochrome c reductase iron-sulfur subunit, partial [Planctomycetaceae bacterium]